MHEKQHSVIYGRMRRNEDGLAKRKRYVSPEGKKEPVNERIDG
jgi:hypothetical protein